MGFHLERVVWSSNFHAQSLVSLENHESKFYKKSNLQNAVGVRNNYLQFKPLSLLSLIKAPQNHLK